MAMLLGDFSRWVLTHFNGNVLFMPSREGYFLRGYFAGGSPYPTVPYLLLSRASLSRLTLISRKQLPAWLLEQPFDGTNFSCLEARFAISQGELLEAVSSKAISPTWLDSMHSADDFLEGVSGLRRILHSGHDREVDTFAARVSAHVEAGPVHLVDIGYSGTIPALMAHVLEREVVCWYFISASGQSTPVTETPGVSLNSRWGSVRWGDGEPLLDLSYGLETMLQAPHGKFLRSIAMPNAVRHEFSKDYPGAGFMAMLSGIHRSACEQLRFVSPTPLPREEAQRYMVWLMRLLSTLSAERRRSASPLEDWSSVGTKDLDVVLSQAERTVVKGL